MKKLAMLATIQISVSMAYMSHSADWPNYLGPYHDNISRETGLMQEWPEGGPVQRWSFPLGEGFGGVAIRDSEVFVLDRVDNDKDVLRCIDLETGEELWSWTHSAPGKTGHNGSRTVPTVTDDYVFAVGLMGDFYCIDRKSHELHWKKNLISDFDGPKPKWGVSQTPFVYKDAVLVAVHGHQIKVVKYDQKTGDVIWTSEDLSPGTQFLYTSPVVLNLTGEDQVVISAASKGDDDAGQSLGLSVDTGRTLWSFDHWRSNIPIPPPTLIPGDRLFFTSGYKAGSAMVRIVRNGSGYAVEKIFQIKKGCGAQLHPAILYGDHLYLNSNGNSEREGMTCLGLDGDIKWQTKQSPNFERGSLIMADGMFYNLDGHTGILHLIQPDPVEYKEVSSFQALDGRKIWAPMAVSDGRLVVRDQDEMKCFSIKR